MNELSIMTEIGPDAELLVRSDEWLDTQRRFLAFKMSQLAAQLGAILSAQRIKSSLQQKNLVAAQTLERDGNHEIVDIAIKIMPIRQALNAVDQDIKDTLGQLNAHAQRTVWLDDGYDL